MSTCIQSETGVIDELTREETPVEKSVNDQDKSKLDYFFKSPEKLPLEQPAFRYRNFLIDNKTRNNRTLPTSQAARSSKMQIQIYKKLFDQLVNKRFPWPEFFEHEQVRAGDLLSEGFLEQLKQISSTADYPVPMLATTLGQLAEIVQSLFQQVGNIEESMELVYLLRDGAYNPQRPRIAVEVHESQSETASADGATSTPSQGSIHQGTTAPTPESAYTLSGDVIIGRLKVKYDDKQLDHWLDRMSTFWHSSRPLKGVTLSETWKCRT